MTHKVQENVALVKREEQKKSTVQEKAKEHPQPDSPQETDSSQGVPEHTLPDARTQERQEAILPNDQELVQEMCNEKLPFATDTHPEPDQPAHLPQAQVRLSLVTYRAVKEQPTPYTTCASLQTEPQLPFARLRVGSEKQGHQTIYGMLDSG